MTKSKRCGVEEHISLVQYRSCPSSLPDSVRLWPDMLVRVLAVPEASDAKPDMVLTEAEDEERRRGYGANSSG